MKAPACMGRSLVHPNLVPTKTELKYDRNSLRASNLIPMGQVTSEKLGKFSVPVFIMVS